MVARRNSKTQQCLGNAAILNEMERLVDEEGGVEVRSKAALQVAALPSVKQKPAAIRSLTVPTSFSRWTSTCSACSRSDSWQSVRDFRT
jgi:hypothetical protein